LAQGGRAEAEKTISTIQFRDVAPISIGCIESGGGGPARVAFDWGAITDQQNFYGNSA
jgi:hypothetical protein